MLRKLAVLLGAGFTLLAAPKSGYIFETAPFQSCHASTIVETKPGQFLAAWFGGTAEGKPDVAIWGSRLENGQWSAPFEMVREPNIATYNPVLFYSKDRTLWMYYKFGEHPSNWSAGRISSKDDGRTWSPVDHLPAGILGPIKNKPLLLPDGAIVSGTSVESYKAWSSWVERSDDNAKTWSKHGPVVYQPSVYNSIQPAIVPLPDGRLRMFVRTTTSVGKIGIADSKDRGLTWSELKLTDLPNPNSGIDAVALKDGRIVMVYNHSPKGRTPLNLAVSSDGDHWQMFQTLESEPGQYSYPAIIQAQDGAVHVTYTWLRKRIKHAEVPLADIPTGKK